MMNKSFKLGEDITTCTMGQMLFILEKNDLNLKQPSSRLILDLK